MNVRNSINFLSELQLEQIENAAKRILSETGFNIQHKKILEDLDEQGWLVDKENERVRFQPDKIENFLDQRQPVDWSNLPPLKIQGGAYCSRVLMPDCDTVEMSTLENTIELTRLGDYLDNIDVMIGMGIPSDVPVKTVPLWQYFIAWRHSQKTESNAGGIFYRECIPYMEEMADILTIERGGRTQDHIIVNVELITPLTFGRHEADVYYDATQRGIHAMLMSIPGLGGTGPVTLAGALGLGIAETWICNILSSMYTGQKFLYYMSSVAPTDMRKGFLRFGRPENALLHMAYGQLARKRKAFHHANCFLSDAQRPSVEAGFQKALTAIPAFLAGSTSTGSVGMLSIDEYNSPVQMILDNEFAGALKRMLKGFEIDEDTLAVDLMSDVGPGGNYLSEEHTAEHYRDEIWMPSIWTGNLDSGWKLDGKKLDVDLARELYGDVMKNYHPRGVSEKTEEELLRVIRRAEKELG